MFFKENFLNSLKSLSLLFITFIMLYVFLIKINSSAVYFLDDLNIVFVAPYNWDVFWRVPDHGSYVSYIPNKIIGFYLARFFKIHPQDFILQCGMYVKCLLFLLLPFFTAVFSAKKLIKKPIFSLFFIFIFMLIFNSLRFSLVEFAMSTAFYRFTMPILLWVIYNLIFYDYYSGSLKPSKIYLITGSLFGFLLGNSSETMASMTLFTGVMLIIFDIFKNPQKTFINKIKNVEKELYIPFLFVFLGFLMLVTNDGFLLQVAIKHSRYPDVTVINTLPMIFVFIKEYFIYVIAKHFVPIFVIFCSVLYLLKLKTNYLKSVYYIASAVLSLFLLYFMMFFAGQTHYDGGFWIKHNDLQFVLHTMLIIIGAISLGEIFNNYDFSKNLKIKIMAVIAFLSVFTITSVNFMQLTDKYYSKLKTIRRNMYLYEKMTLFYWTKGEKAVVPYDFDFSNILGYIAFDKNIRNFAFEEDDEMHKYYMETNYPKVKYHGYIFVEPKTAFEQFINSGGKISNKEMNDIKFQRLYDYIE